MKGKTLLCFLFVVSVFGAVPNKGKGYFDPPLEKFKNLPNRLAGLWLKFKKQLQTYGNFFGKKIG